MDLKTIALVSGLVVGGIAVSSVFSSAKAATIPNLFNTGIDNSGNPLGSGVGDPHYTLTSFPSGSATTAVAVTNTSNGLWTGNTTTSEWIAPYSDSNAIATVGQYKYQTTFTLPKDFSTASITGQWATDNEGVNILINGNSTASTTPSSGFTFNNFTISSGFVAGTNTLDFIVNNGTLPLGGTINPTGLQVNSLVGNYTTILVPEPLNILGATTGLVLFGTVSTALKKRKVSK